MWSRFRLSSEGIRGSRVSRGFLLAATLGMCAALLPAAASAQEIPSLPPPVYSSMDKNDVDLVSGQVIHSEKILSIDDPNAGGLVYKRVLSGKHVRDSFTGTLNDVATCALVSIGSNSQDCDSITATGASLQNLGGGLYKYTMTDGTVAEFSSAWASTLPTKADGGRVTSMTYPNGERLEFHYETVATDTVYLKSVTSNLGYQVKFSQTAPNIAVYAVNMAVDTCDPEAWTCAGLTEEVQPFSTASTYTVFASAIRITRPSGAIINYTLDAQDRVTSVTSAVGTWNYSYVDNSGADTRTTTVTDPLSNTRLVVSKLSTGRVISDTDQLGRTTTFQYDSSKRLVRITRPEGNYTQYTYDARGNITEVRKVAKPGSGLADIVTSATYPDSRGCSNRKICNKPTSVTDERGKVTDFTYDPAHGGVLTITRPDPGNGVRPQTRIAYQAFYARYKDATGTIVTAPTPVYVPVSGSACANGEAPGCLGTADETEVTIDYGDMSPSVASNLLPVSQTVRAGDGSVSATTSLAYDAAGNVVSIDGPLPGADDTTHFRYDANRLRVGVIGPDPDGAGALKYRARRTTWNADGYPVSVERGTVNGLTDTDWSAFVMLEETITEYDSINRAVKRKRVANGATRALRQFSYDANSRLECTAVRMDPSEFASTPASACTLGTDGPFGADRITKNVYDAAGRLTQVTEALGTAAERDEKTITYTQNGRVATLVDGEGNLTTYEYDGFDRKKKMFYPTAANGSISSTTDYDEYTYEDGTGLLLALRTRDGQLVSFSHDDLGRVTFVDKPAGEDDLTFDHDNFGRMVSASQTGHALSFIYDALGRKISETGPLGTMTHEYDAAGRRTRLSWPDGFYVNYDYDPSNAVTAVRENGAMSGAGVLAAYAYDDLGRRTGVTRGNGATTSYSYDDAQRLETLTHDFAGTADDQTLSFVRNPLSQIMTRTGSNAAFDWDDHVAEATSYGVNGLNQVTSIGAIAVSFDGRGNLVADGAKTYAYDVDNRLTAVSGGGTLEYDPLSRLYEVSDGVTATKFLTDGPDVIAEYDASGSTLLRRYVHGPGMDEPLVWYEGSGTSDRRWLAADERGSVIAVSDDTGAVTVKNTYDEFGMPAAGNQGRFQYTGQMWLPEVGLYHYKSRTYAPGIGRFLQADPIGYAAGMNLYAYVGNDPVNFVDPFGLKWSCQTVDGEEVCTFIDGGGGGGGGGFGGGGGGYSGGGGSGEGPGGVFGPPVDDTIVVIGQPIEINIPTMPITLSGGGRGAGGPKGEDNPDVAREGCKDVAGLEICPGQDFPCGPMYGPCPRQLTKPKPLDITAGCAAAGLATFGASGLFFIATRAAIVSAGTGAGTAFFTGVLVVSGVFWIVDACIN